MIPAVAKMIFPFAKMIPAAAKMNTL